MPALELCGYRQWYGSDDFGCLSLLEIGARITWIAVLMNAADWPYEEDSNKALAHDEDCETVIVLMFVWGFIGLQLFIILNAISIFACSCRGTLTDAQPRSISCRTCPQQSIHIPHPTQNNPHLV